MTGLPFAAATGVDFTTAFVSSGAVFEGSNNDGIVGHIDGGSSTFELRAQDGNNVSVTWSATGSDVLQGTLVYFTD